MQAISLQTFIPIRKEPSDTSEMVSQLLFGETCSIIKHHDSWVYIQTHFDNYYGWVFKKSLTFLTKEQIEKLHDINPLVIGNLITQVVDIENQQPYFLTAGCQIHAVIGKNISVFDKHFYITEAIHLNKQKTLNETILQMALKMINIPYLWGGRSTLGIDCSGLVQTCYKVADISLPRDANQQAQIGKQVESLKKALPADLAFFKNENDKIIHVGILINSKTIIHASQRVKISLIDDTGIIDNDSQKNYSHQLAIIKRIF